MNIIKPSVGQKVWLWPNGLKSTFPIEVGDENQPFDATIVFVCGGNLVNVSAMDHIGNHHTLSCRIRQDGEVAPSGPYCEFPPQQDSQQATAHGGARKPPAASYVPEQQTPYPFGDAALLQQARDLCAAIERLPAGEHASKMSGLAGDLAFGLQQLQATGDHFWPRKMVFVSGLMPEKAQKLIKAGDTVTLNGGGQEMAVRCVWGDVAWCTWGEKNELFSFSALTVLKTAA